MMIMSPSDLFGKLVECAVQNASNDRRKVKKNTQKQNFFAPKNRVIPILSGQPLFKLNRLCFRKL